MCVCGPAPAGDTCCAHTAVAAASSVPHARVGAGLSEVVVLKGGPKAALAGLSCNRSHPSSGHLVGPGCSADSTGFRHASGVLGRHLCRLGLGVAFACTETPAAHARRRSAVAHRKHARCAQRGASGPRCKLPRTTRQRRAHGPFFLQPQQPQRRQRQAQQAQQPQNVPPKKTPASMLAAVWSLGTHFKLPS